MHGTVVRTTWLTPAMVRVVLGGDGLADYQHVAATDAYINVAIAPADAPYGAPFDLDRVRAEQPEDLQPLRRRYTVRHFSPERRELTVDVVVHDGGPGGRWAAGAGPGDVLTFTGPSGGFQPNPDADHHLFAGDESALPSIAVSLEALPPTATGTALLVVDGPDHELDVPHPPGIELRWLHRSGHERHDARLLPDAVAELPELRGHLVAFVHGEAGEVREVRRHLLAERGIARTDLSCSPYWRRHMTDEAWRAVKREWTADLERDVA
jgi:NADPH-dependent ferric siderophore reductase